MEIATGATALVAGAYKTGSTIHNLSSRKFLARGQQYIARGTDELERSFDVIDSDVVHQHLEDVLKLQQEEQRVAHRRSSHPHVGPIIALPGAIRFQRHAEKFSARVNVTSNAARRNDLHHRNLRRRGNSYPNYAPIMSEAMMQTPDSILDEGGQVLLSQRRVMSAGPAIYEERPLTHEALGGYMHENYYDCPQCGTSGSPCTHLLGESDEWSRSSSPTLYSECYTIPKPVIFTPDGYPFSAPAASEVA